MAEERLNGGCSTPPAVVLAVPSEPQMGLAVCKVCYGNPPVRCGHCGAMPAATSEQEIIARFLERTGQYVTNDATREAFRVNVLEEALKACDDVDEPGWTGYECPNTFQDGVSAAKDAIRAKLDALPAGAGEKTS